MPSEQPRWCSQRALPAVTRRPSTRPSTPIPAPSTTSSGTESARRARSGGLHDRLPHHVGRQPLDRRHQAQQLVGGDVADRRDALDGRSAGGERPGLVEQHRAGPAELLDGARALGDDAAPRGAREPRHQRDGRRQDERAGCRHHEHGQARAPDRRSGPRRPSRRRV